jgi:hypothetical protein
MTDIAQSYFTLQADIAREDEQREQGRIFKKAAEAGAAALELETQLSSSELAMTQYIINRWQERGAQVKRWRASGPLALKYKDSDKDDLIRLAARAKIFQTKVAQGFLRANFGQPLDELAAEITTRVLGVPSTRQVSRAAG